MTDAETIAWLQGENERLRKRAAILQALLSSKLDAALRDPIERAVSEAAASA